MHFCPLAIISVLSTQCIISKACDSWTSSLNILPMVCCWITSELNLNGYADTVVRVLLMSWYDLKRMRRSASVQSTLYFTGIDPLSPGK